MRRRFTAPLIAAIGIAPWLWFYPDAPPAEQPAALVSVLDLPTDADWMGGFSGMELTPDGTGFYLVTDRGYIAKGLLHRVAGRLERITFTDAQPIVDDQGRTREFPHTDAEGLALDAQGKVFISFERAHRVLSFDAWEAPARWPSYTRAWRALPNNAGLEALAIDAQGTLYAIPEEINAGARESLVYRRQPQEKWRVDITLPIDSEFAPVGADFGPDGRLYVLERAIYPFGFYSRVRAMRVSDGEFTDIRTVLQTPLARHGNLEGIAVWRDAAGAIRLTIVSDDNFYPFMRGQIVEYVLNDRVALPAQ